MVRRRFLGQAEEEGAAGSAELAESGAAGGAALEVPFHENPVWNVGAAGGDGEQDFFRRVHGRAGADRAKTIAHCLYVGSGGSG